MNIHFAQSLQARNELVQLAAVPYQIITPKDSKPIVSIVQDVALGVYRMTKSVVFANEKQFFNLMATNPKFFGHVPRPVVDGQASRWSGRQLLSTIIPPNVNYKGENKSFDENKKDEQGNNVVDKENLVVIKNGDITQGRIDTKIYQDMTKGLIHSIYNEYGPEEARIFLDNTQQLVCNWLVLSGFSVGISDLIVDKETNGSLKNIINDMKVNVYDIIRNVHTGQFLNDTRKSNNDKFEEEVNRLLNDATKRVGNLGLSKIDDLSNRMLNMIKSGAKGNPINIAQMIGCLGQQNVEGKRIGYGYDSRTLPHYTKYDDGPESRGFVENSFIKGLTPQEFFFHAMGGREGLIDENACQ
jgi:DNA-directed RNA polymerase II subunit RPB1